MTPTQEADRAQIVGRAAAAGLRQGRREPQLREFLTRYYRHVALEDLRERDPVDLVGAALSHRQLAAFRPQGVATVRVFAPTVDEHAWSSGHTVVEIVTDDMPFLVDSVNAELPRDAIVESWTHVEIDRVTQHEELELVATNLRRVLEDVRVAVEDWPRMREQIRIIAQELAAGLVGRRAFHHLTHPAPTPPPRQRRVADPCRRGATDRVTAASD
jgi:glutamate dehydrogenase